MMTRRGFGKTMTGVLAGLVVALTGLPARARKLAVKLAQVPAVSKIGGSVILKLAGTQVMLIRTDDAKIVAISPVCTHAQCFVSYNQSRRQMVCHCHGSTFDLSGKVLTGPAGRPLPVYEASLDGDRVIVSVD